MFFSSIIPFSISLFQKLILIPCLESVILKISFPFIFYQYLHNSMFGVSLHRFDVIGSYWFCLFTLAMISSIPYLHNGIISSSQWPDDDFHFSIFHSMKKSFVAKINPIFNNSCKQKSLLSNILFCIQKYSLLQFITLTKFM